MGVMACPKAVASCLASFVKQYWVFIRYLWSLMKRRSMSREDFQVSLALYVLYPALLWLFLNVFHGLCGLETYDNKVEAIQACKSLYFWFCFLMRSYKLAIIHVYGIEKQGSDRNLGRGLRRSTANDEGISPARLKCQTWFHLSQEMTLVGWVVFLLLICLPVLAFWSMFLSILVTVFNILVLIRRLWITAQRREDAANMARDEEADDEFQEFLSNFTDEDPGW
ncbi:unnamed protein product [Cylindrotheca closterium]|uniref:Uncharacterized protein n=1 Tax=Cylindrotheca closterium TaxID=2856 RepID=A0AAD2CK07_9STRA|nr:unnamed protein product [Cylindrotheca closterium]